MAQAGRKLRPISQRYGVVPGDETDPAKLAGTISYNEESKIFRLYGKNSMYAFRVDERGSLEHLHWGSALDPHDDLRYLCFSNESLPFDPGPGVFFENMAPLSDLIGPPEFQDPDILRREWDTARAVQTQIPAMEENPLTGPLALEQAELAAFEARRRENATWRLMKMQEIQARRGSKADGESDASGDVFDGLEDADDEGDAPPPSSRASSNADDASPFSSRSMVDQRVRSVQSLLSSTDGEDGERPNLVGWGGPGSVATGLGGVPPPPPSGGMPIPGGSGTLGTNTPVTGIDGTPPAGATSWMLQMQGSNLARALGATVDYPRPQLIDFQAPEVGRNSVLLEYSDGGTGDFRPPSFEVEYHDGSSVSPVVYSSHRILRGKLPMSSASGKLPELRGEEDNCMTLVVTMADTLTGLKIDLIYTVYRDVDAVVRRANIRNASREEVRLTKLFSATVDFHSNNYTLVHLSGSWANERHITERRLEAGKSSVESTRGTSSHQHNPFAAITVGPPHEDHGDVYAFNLVYSGNFRIEAEVTESDRLRVNVGINPDRFEWHLPSGDSFESPECVMVWSGSGMTNMSHQFHRLYRRHLMPPRWVHEVCPVLVNTWEAMYFGVTHDRVMELATAAAQSGCEMLVLDDGWFGDRNDATSSLGDWFPDVKKLPKGLTGLVEDVNGLGLRFGLWIEPEMINIKSKLYQEHPDWCLHQAGRPHSEGRNQLVLDLGRSEVREYIYGVIAANLASANIEYVKWDMNRHLTEVYGNGLKPQKQGEVYHRYMVGVYKLALQLTSNFPHIRFEMCSGGGGRFDPGMLYYAPQIWTSDNTDAISRMRIQHGTSMCYPLSCMGSHISAVPNHQTNRLTTFKTRFLVALFGSFGLELDLARLGYADMAELNGYIKLHKELAPVVLEGDLYRLWSPYTTDATAWMVVHEERAVLAAFLNFQDPGRFLPRLRLKGLDRQRVYEVEELIPNTAVRNPNTAALEVQPGGAPQWQLGRRSIEISGSSLMDVGLPVRLSFDGDSVAFKVTAVDVLKAEAAAKAEEGIITPGSGPGTPS